MYAAAHGHVASVRRLVAGGAVLEARDMIGCTAFLHACGHGKTECAEVLLDAGCDASVVNDNAWTGLMYAAAHGHVALVRRLVAGGAVLEARDMIGCTAFLHACGHGKTECAEVLLDVGCDAAAVTTECSWTGLELAELNVSLRRVASAVSTKSEIPNTIMYHASRLLQSGWWHEFARDESIAESEETARSRLCAHNNCREANAASSSGVLRADLGLTRARVCAFRRCGHAGPTNGIPLAGCTIAEANSHAALAEKLRTRLVAERAVSSTLQRVGELRDSAQHGDALRLVQAALRSQRVGGLEDWRLLAAEREGEAALALEEAERAASQDGAERMAMPGEDTGAAQAQNAGTVAARGKGGGLADFGGPRLPPEPDVDTHFDTLWRQHTPAPNVGEGDESNGAGVGASSPRSTSTVGGGAGQGQGEGRETMPMESGDAAQAVGEHDIVIVLRDVVRLFEQAAKQGHPHAAHRLGCLYARGLCAHLLRPDHRCIWDALGVPRDVTRAVRCWENAAADGHAPALYELGLCYYYADGVPMDKVKASELLWRAVARGYRPAQYALGCFFLDGTGFFKSEIHSDSHASATYHYAYAMHGSPASNYEYDGSYRRPKDRTRSYRRQQPGVKAEASRLLEMAAAPGRADAIQADARFRLSARYKHGEGVAKDAMESTRLCRLAAEQGHDCAQLFAGDAFYHGDGVAEDPVEAVRLWGLAAAQCELGGASGAMRRAQCQLGVCYATGQGVAQDLVEAARQYELAADLLPHVDEGICTESVTPVLNDEETSRHLTIAMRDAAPCACGRGWHMGVRCRRAGLGVHCAHGIPGYRLRNMRSYRLLLAAWRWWAADRSRGWVGYTGEIHKATGAPVRAKIGRASGDVERGDQPLLRSPEAPGGLRLAQFKLGVCYAKAQGVAQDLVKAARLYGLAADQGVAHAQRELGLCYATGRGVATNVVEAARLYGLAADQGDALAQRELGLCYATGRGVATNVGEAARLYELAADQGDARAQCEVGLRFAEKSAKWACGLVVRGGAQLMVKAAHMFILAAKQGEGMAQCELGRCYARGQGVDKSLGEAALWLGRAAAQGNARAQHELGLCYATGRGVATDGGEAARLYGLAADQGDARAQCELGLFYAKARLRRVTTPDGRVSEVAAEQRACCEEARLYGLAAAQGDARALYELSGCYANGHGVEKNVVEAARLAGLAAAQGDARARYALSCFYANGHGVKKNVVEAERLAGLVAGACMADTMFIVTAVLRCVRSYFGKT